MFVILTSAGLLLDSVIGDLEKALTGLEKRIAEDKLKDRDKMLPGLVRLLAVLSL